jgi:hypothetical protein
MASSIAKLEKRKCMGGFAMEEISRQPAGRILKTMWVYLQ